MNLSRLDLDGVGSPREIAARIHELAPELPTNFSIHDLCQQLDIDSIEEVSTDAFEAALLMEANKAFGSILLAKGRSAKRHRFSIGHELGHFLIHRPRPGEPFHCSLADLHLVDSREKDRRKRIEAEANRFAAALLLPPVRLRKAMTSRQPGLDEICQLAAEFGMSKEAMARAYVEAHRQTIAVLILEHGLIKRVYQQGAPPPQALSSRPRLAVMREDTEYTRMIQRLEEHGERLGHGPFGQHGVVSSSCRADRRRLSS